MEATLYRCGHSLPIANSRSRKSEKSLDRPARPHATQPMSDDFLQPSDLIALAKPQQTFADPPGQRHRLEQLPHLRGRKQLLHRCGLAQIRRGVYVRASSERVENSGVDQESRLRRVARD